MDLINLDSNITCNAPSEIWVAKSLVILSSEYDKHFSGQYYLICQNNNQW